MNHFKMLTNGMTFSLVLGSKNHILVFFSHKLENGQKYQKGKIIEMKKHLR